LAQLIPKDVIKINVAALIKGFQDGFSGSEPVMTEQQCMEVLAKVSEQVQAWELKRMQAEAEKNRAAAKSFFAENGKKKTVMTLPSGLQYEELRPGTGKKPTARSTVHVHYHGTLLDGTVFDSSVERNEPISFPVNGVIQGWQEALQLMPQGAKWKIFIPSNLAYGSRGSPPDIGPDAALVFEVELLGVQ
jgi:FKBP-type peptidyl-prolyl cis-trans isomerase FklB